VHLEFRKRFYFGVAAGGIQLASRASHIYLHFTTFSGLILFLLFVKFTLQGVFVYVCSKYIIGYLYVGTIV